MCARNYNYVLIPSWYDPKYFIESICFAYNEKHAGILVKYPRPQKSTSRPENTVTITSVEWEQMTISTELFQ